MDFKKFLEMVTEAESTAEKDDKAEKAAKKVAKDIEYDEGHKGKDDDKAEKAGEKVKKDIEYDDKKDKKSLKDWFEIIDKNMLAEAEQLTIEPAKQSTQIIKQGTKTLGTVSNPALAATIKSAIGKGEMSLAGDALKEEEPMMEKAPPGMEDVVLSLKKKFPGEEGRAYAIAWSMYNKKHGKTDEGMTPYNLPQKNLNQDKATPPKTPPERPEKQRERVPFEAAEDNPDSAMLDEKWAGDAKIKATGEYSGKSVEELKSMLLKLHKSGPHKAGSPEAKKQHQINFALRSKGGWKKGEGAALKEVDQPTIDNMSARGAGLGAGRNPDVLETKQVNESMNTLEAAYHEGKSHGLTKHSYACRYDEGTDEHRRYHEGFKEGLDECYGLMPNRGLVVDEGDMPAATVPGMASQAMPAMEADMDEGNAFTAALAKTPKGGKFTVGGKTFTDRSDYSAKIDEFAFEALDKQLNDLLNEGLSVNMSQGLNDGMGGHMGDTVSVTATEDDAAKLLDFIKQVGLGGLGADKAQVGSVEKIAAVSDYGAPKFNGHDDMLGLMKVVSDDDYKDEEGHEHDHAEPCNECGMMEGCGCSENKEMVDEVETPDQLEYQVAEDDGEGYEQSQADAGKIDSALAMSGASKGGATNEDGAEAPGSNPVGQAEQEASEEVNEESTAEKDDHAERAGKEVKKDIEYDDKKDKKLDEWANDAGKDGTQQAFTRDIEFMTKVISGGLNKPKSTGQTTIPVIAGQEAREGDEDVQAWKKLAGLAK